MTDRNAVVGIFDSHQAAEQAVRTLEHAGMRMGQLSIVGRDYRSEEHVLGYYTTGDRMAGWGKLGAFWGGLWGVLVGAAFLTVPGVGAVVVAGPLVAAIVGGLEGAVVVGGLSALGAGLYSLGIPKHSVLRYEAALQADKYLLVFHGTADETSKAREILEGLGTAHTEQHHAE